MAESRRHGRAVARWLLAIAILAVVVSDFDDDTDVPARIAGEDSGPTAKFRITSISEADVSPGDAVVVHFDGAEPVNVEARLARRPAEILLRTEDSVVVLIPRDLPVGKAKLQLAIGREHTKGWDLSIRPSKHKRMIARLLGGLALFVFGLELFAGGLRGLAGSRLRGRLGRWTRSPPQAIGVGVVVGGITQLTTSAAAFAIGLVDARLVTLAPTMAIFVGAQLGASITGALLPVGLASESLLVIAIGVVWNRLATTRHTRAIASLLLGMGLMLYGLHLLQTSIQPLVGDPQLLPYVAVLHGDGVAALAACAAAGAVLALVLQGPGPVYILVLGLAQTSGVVPGANALAILAGTGLGAAAGMALVAWQSGRTRPLIGPHLAFGMFASCVAFAAIPVWRVCGLDDDTIAYGHHVVRPDISLRLAIAFAGSQVVATVAWVAAIPALARRVAAPVPVPTRLPTTAIIASIHDALAEVARTQRAATSVALAISCAADRTQSADIEQAVADAQRTLQAQYTATSGARATPQLQQLDRLVVAFQQLQRQVEQLIGIAELGVERGLRLTADEQARLHRMHVLIDESFAAVLAALHGDTNLDLEAAGAREIELNQLEAEGRAARRRVPTDESASIGLDIASLIDAYEHVGNQLFRVSRALVEEP